MNSTIRKLFKQSPNFRQRVANYFDFKAIIKKAIKDVGEDHEAIKIAREKEMKLRQEIIKIIRENEAP